MSCWFSLFPFSKVGTRCISQPPDLRTKIWGEILGLYTGIYSRHEQRLNCNRIVNEMSVYSLMTNIDINCQI